MREENFSNTNATSPAGETADGVTLSLLVAADEQNLIGSHNRLPWHLPNDLKYFKNQTWAMPILMGRKTFESIGHPLRGRHSIIITRNPEWNHQGVTVVHSIDGAIEKAKQLGATEIFVIGGAEIFQDAFQKAARIYLTRIHHRFDGDAFFPRIEPAQWNQVQNHFCAADEKNAFAHTFQVWEKKHL